MALPDQLSDELAPDETGATGNKSGRDGSSLPILMVSLTFFAY
jgi:hypothetical protein